MEAVTLTADNRTVLGKKVKALRRSGQIPVHMYGLDREPASLQAEAAALKVALRTAGYTTPVTIRVGGGEEAVTLVRHIHRHAVSGEIQHVDFLRVDPERPIEAPVPVVLFNQDKAPGIRGGAGTVTQGIYEVTVRARPFDVPREIRVDCSVLADLETVITAAELPLPAGVEIAEGGEAHVAWIQPPRVSEAPAAAAQPAEGAEAAQPAGGEARAE